MTPATDTKTPREYLLEQAVARLREQAETLRTDANARLGTIPDGGYMNLVDRINRLTMAIREASKL